MFDTPPFRMYVCAGLHCTPAGRRQLLQALEAALWDLDLTSQVEIRESSCLNRCTLAPNVTVWPGPFRYTQLTPEHMRRIVAEHIGKGQPVAELLAPDLT